MVIIVKLDVIMAKRKMNLKDISQKVDISLANLSILKNNKCKAIRFANLNMLCKVLDSTPGDLLQYSEE